MRTWQKFGITLVFCLTFLNMRYICYLYKVSNYGYLEELKEYECIPSKNLDFIIRESKGNAFNAYTAYKEMESENYVIPRWYSALYGSNAYRDWL